MNSREPIVLMLALGLIVVTALTLTPYALNSTDLRISAVATALPSPPSGDKGGAVRDPSPPSSEQKEAKKIVVAAQPKIDAATWYAERGEEPERHAVLIETADRSRILASLNPDTSYNPASITKLATSLVALKKLGPDYRFETKLYADGEVDAKGTLQGSLKVIGADPTFGDVGANFVAKELKARGVKRVRDGVGVSPTFSFNFGGAADSAARLAQKLNLGPMKAAVLEEKEMPAGGESLFAFRSNALRDVLLYMNAHSNNFVADGVGALVGGPAGVRQTLIDEVGLDAGKILLESCSGLGRNRMTPRDIIAVLRALLVESRRRQMQPEDLMPIAQTDWGTLRHRLAGTGLEHAVVGKTGTLTTIDGGMACLAGYVYTQDAGPVVFAILDHGNGLWNNRQMEDQLLSEVIHLNSTPQVISGPTPRPLLPTADLGISAPGE